MVARYSSVILTSLVMAVVGVGCATQSSTPPASVSAGAETPSAAVGTAVVPVSQTERPGAAPASTMTARPAVQDFAAVAALRDVHFEFDSYDIRPADARVLEVSAGWLKAHPEHLVLIEGHADERGTNEYNLTLGERRAKASMNYLVSHGVQASRITLVSYGEERNVCRETNETCWSKNRRAHFLVKAR
jgi:peptidoglycan-associated lipoprotein